MLKHMLVTGLLAAGSAAVAGGSLTYSPTPRWQEEPETEAVCAAIEKECPALWAKGEIEADVAYDELYDVKGELAGVRVTKGTGCAPLDESLAMGHAKFRLAFHEEGKPDLDETRVELRPGIDPDGVRIVKSSGTSLSMGCH
jgi:hypothetical protein